MMSRRGDTTTGLCILRSIMLVRRVLYYFFVPYDAFRGHRAISRKLSFYLPFS